MKISWNWLRELTPLKTASAEALAEKLTLHTAEVEEVIALGDDFLIDIDNKSLTHRPDLMGHWGFAREISALEGRKWEFPFLEDVKGNPEESLEVRIETPHCHKACFVRASRGIEVRPSEDSGMIRLESLGTRSINNIVDITNLVMLELGQPMHVFDADKVEGALIIRPAKLGEKLVALDGKTYSLTPQDTVVADEKKVLSIAGIMGGLESGVTFDTKRIIFEACRWDPVTTRITSQRLALRSESSLRYEKSLDPSQCPRALKRAVEYLRKTCPKAEITSEVIDLSPKEFPILEIEFDPNLPRLQAGVDFSDDFIEKSLSNLGFTVERGQKTWKVQVPSDRSTKDVAIPEDLSEEVIRLHGFEFIPASFPTFPINPPQKSFLRHLEWRVRDGLSLLGYLEVYGYSFSDAQEVNFSGKADMVKVKNPLSSLHAHLRQTLGYGMIKGIESELRTHKNLAFFETGKVFTPEEGSVLPEERLKLLVLKASLTKKDSDVFYELKADLQRWMAQQENLDLKITKIDDSAPFWHPQKSGSLLVNGQCIGQFGVLHPAFSPAREAAIAFAEIDLEALAQYLEKYSRTYQKINPYPKLSRDLSIVLPRSIEMAKVETVLFQSSSLLQGVELFDVYVSPEKLGKDLKNLAFHLYFQSKEGTLEDSVVDHEFNGIIALLKKELGAVLRLEFDKLKK